MIYPWEAIRRASTHWTGAPRCEKTQSPARPETPLEFLHAAFARLLEAPESTEPFSRLLRQLQEYAGASEGALFVFPEEGGSLRPWAWTAGADHSRLLRLLAGRPALSLVRGFTAQRLLADSKSARNNKVLAVSLQHEGRCIGFLALRLAGSQEDDLGHAAALKKTAGGIAAMIHGARRARVNRTAALCEERAAIARDLHDSLAQSLSYGKIQVSRLQPLLRNDQPWESMEIDSIVQELRSNLNMAYRQLRELITTCRLTMNGRNLDQALEDSVEEFGKRSGIAFELDNRAIGIPLKAEEEMQVLHIVREALSNIVRHSHARHAAVRLFASADDVFTVCINDDGTGVPTNPSDEPHHGIMIMQERAHRLGGDFALENSAGGGTRLSVNFVPERGAGGPSFPSGAPYDDIRADRINRR